MKLFTDKKSRFGKPVNINGEIIEIGKDGSCEVPENKAKELIEKYGFTESLQEVKIEEKPAIELIQKESLLVEVENLKKEKEELLKEIESLKEIINGLGLELDALKPVTANENPEDFEKEIKNKSKKELVELCNEMKFPESEWESLTANELKSYIIKKAEID